MLLKGFDAVEETAGTERTEIRFLTGLTMNHLRGDSPVGSRPVLLVSGLLFALLVGESLAARLHWEGIFQAFTTSLQIFCVFQDRCPL